MLKTVGNPSIRYGDQTIVSGNLVIGTAGKGIDFSADPSAPGMTSELLDDYEEGTWTPAPDGTTTFTTAIGTYTKVGNLVHVDFKIVVSSTQANFFQIFGLPFAVAASPDYSASSSISRGDAGTYLSVGASGTALAFFDINNVFVRYNTYNGKTFWGGATYRV